MLPSVDPQGAQPSDVLIINIGIIYALNDPVEIGYITSWREEAARSMVAGINMLLPGKVIYVNVSPMQSDPPPTKIDLSQLRFIEERAIRYNGEIARIILDEAPRWQYFGVYSLCKPVMYSPLYADTYHFPGHLTQIGWHILSHMMCSFG